VTDLTLLLLQRGDKVLLALKKRGFGVGRWNGVGGKLEPGETIQQALVRECQEEIGVTPIEYHEVGQLQFDAYMKGARVELLVHVYVCRKWRGTPKETEEMKPRWFSKNAVPYDDMWQDDRFWLPQALDGAHVSGQFAFDEQDNLLDYKVEEITKVR
jgi:mutator protein MutT